MKLISEYNDSNITNYITEDKKGNKWVIYDHNSDPELDTHLINSFPEK